MFRASYRIVLTTAPLWLSGCFLVVDLPEPAGGDAGAETEASGGQPSAGGAPQEGDAASGAGGSSSGGCADPCDCDGDGAKAVGPDCGGIDCNDKDDRVHPGQEDFFEEPADGSYDYDCDGEEKREHTSFIVCDPVDCPAEAGFLESVPDCGKEHSWGTCTQSLAGTVCDRESREFRKQACR